MVCWLYAGVSFTVLHVVPWRGKTWGKRSPFTGLVKLGKDPKESDSTAAAAAAAAVAAAAAAAAAAAVVVGGFMARGGENQLGLDLISGCPYFKSVPTLRVSLL